MSSSMIARRWMLVFLVAVLAVLEPSIWSQKLRRRETNAHFRRALEEVVGKNRVDRATAERLRGAFLVPIRPWDKERATNSITEAIIRKDFGLTHDGNRFQIVLEPSKIHLDPPFVREMSSRFVDSMSSVIRRLSVIEEIGPVTSTMLDHDQLRNHLKDTMHVPDYDSVTESFDPALTTEVVAFTQETTLLRLYGGESKAIGRYFFCCRWFADRQRPFTPTFWSDASGLATPPENLRRHLAVVRIPAGTTAIIGTVADNFADQLGRLEKGGNAQIFIPHVKTFPFEQYRLASFADITEIAVQSDDRILRFRR